MKVREVINMSIREKILGSKKARGLIIAGVLFGIYIYIEWISDLTTGESIFNSFWVGIAMAFLITAGLVIKEIFDIKESWKLGLLIFIIALFIAFVVIR